jgi:hypothetical protein
MLGYIREKVWLENVNQILECCVWTSFALRQSSALNYVYVTSNDYVAHYTKGHQLLQRTPLGILCTTFTEYFPILLPSVTVRLIGTATDVTIYRGAGRGGFMNIWTASRQASYRGNPTQTYSGQANKASKIKDNCEFKWRIQTSRIRVPNGQWIVIENFISIAFWLPLI